MPEAPISPRLEYNLMGPIDGPRVVLVNGLGGVQAAFLHQVRALVDYFRVLTFDHRGVGKSEVVDEPVTMHHFAQDLVRLLDHLDWTQPISALGLSFGGRVLQELAVAWPDRLERLVLCCTSGGGTKGFDSPLRGLAGATEEQWREIVAPALFGPRYLRQHPRRVEHLARWRARHPSDPIGINRQWQAFDGFDLRERLGEVRCPTLVIHGGDDALISPERARELADGIPEARLVVMDGVGHSPNVEEPDKFNLILRDFLLSEVHHSPPH